MNDKYQKRIGDRYSLLRGRSHYEGKDIESDFQQFKYENYQC